MMMLHANNDCGRKKLRLGLDTPSPDTTPNPNPYPNLNPNPNPNHNRRVLHEGEVGGNSYAHRRVRVGLVASMCFRLMLMLIDRVVTPKRSPRIKGLSSGSGSGLEFLYGSSGRRFRYRGIQRLGLGLGLELSPPDMSICFLYHWSDRIRVRVRVGLRACVMGSEPGADLGL